LTYNRVFCHRTHPKPDVTKQPTLQHYIKALRSQYSFREMAELPEFAPLREVSNLPHMVLYRLSIGKEPSANPIRLALGLAPRVQIQACPVCGEVHLRKHPQRRPKRSLFDRSIKELKWMLENRKEIS
jgi:hypothetical protein